LQNLANSALLTFNVAAGLLVSFSTPW